MVIVMRNKKDKKLGCYNQHSHPSPQISGLTPLISSVGNDAAQKSSTRTEVDSHANMVVVGKNSTIFDDNGKKGTVNAFSETAGKLEDVPIVDTVVTYDCPYQCRTYLLLMRNALHIPELDVNLLPPFIVREAGIQLDECPKFQTSNPTVDSHSMYISNQNLRIPFKLINKFLYFETRKPTGHELYTGDKIFITHDASNWNPHSYHYSMNEQIILDDDGNIREVKPHEKYIMEEHETAYLNTPSVKSIDADIDALLGESSENNMNLNSTHYSNAVLEVNKVVDELEDCSLKCKISTAIGSMVTGEPTCPLFITSFELLEEIFTSHASSITAKQA